MVSAHWTIPRAFEGETVAVLASGPSMSQAVADAVRASGIPAIAVNTTFRLAPWAWALYAADSEWWQHRANRDAWDFGGLKLSVDNDGSRPMASQGVLYVQKQPETRFDIEAQGCVATFGNSGAQALQIAIKTGAARVLLCGFDMHLTSVANHWHGKHPAGLRDTTAENYANWVQRMDRAAPQMLRMTEIVNCTPGSALQGFPRGVLEEELAACVH